MKRVRLWRLVLAIFILLPLAAVRPDTPASASAPATQTPTRWEKEIAAYEAADRSAPPAAGGIVFVGSSSIRLWKTLPQDFPEYPVLNRGFGGCELSDCVFYAPRIVLPYKPRLIVVHAGTNDIANGKTPEQVFADFKAFVTLARAALPETRIAFISINPSPRRWAQRAAQQQANALIRDYIATAANMDYIDIWGALLGPDGTPRPELYQPDRLHNNAAGYKIRVAVVRPHLAPVPTP